MALIEYNPPTEPWIEVVVEDEDILVVNKPSGTNLDIPSYTSWLREGLEAAK